MRLIRVPLRVAATLGNAILRNYSHDRVVTTEIESVNCCRMNANNQNAWLPATNGWQTSSYVVLMAMPSLFLFHWGWVLSVVTLYLICAFRMPLGVTLLSFLLGVVSIAWLGSLAWAGDAFSQFAVVGLLMLTAAGMAIVLLDKKKYFERLANSFLSSDWFYVSRTILCMAFGIAAVTVCILALTRIRSSPRMAMLSLSMLPAACWVTMDGWKNRAQRLPAEPGREREPD